MYLILKKNEKLLVIKDNIVLVEMSYLNPTLDLKNILFRHSLEEGLRFKKHKRNYQKCQ